MCVSSGESYFIANFKINHQQTPHSSQAFPQQTLFLKRLRNELLNVKSNARTVFHSHPPAETSPNELYVYQKSLFLLPPPLMKHWCSSLNLTSDSLCNFNASLCQKKKKKSVSLSVILSLVCVKVAEENLVSFVPSEAVS